MVLSHLRTNAAVSLFSATLVSRVVLLINQNCAHNAKMIFFSLFMSKPGAELLKVLSFKFHHI